MDDLMDEIPDKYRSEIPESEHIELCLKGANKEWLVCTDRKLHIIKHGFMTGHMVGGGSYQMPYANITGVQTDYHMLSGYFEVSTGGMQNTPKSYWSNDRKDDPKAAPNCVSITGRDMLERFQQACDFINAKTSSSHQSASAPTDAPVDLEHLAELHAKGILTDEEFSAAKRKALGI